MKYSTIVRYALATVAIVAFTCNISSCKSRQYVGPVNGKILKSDDLMKDSKTTDNTPIQQLNSLDNK